MSKIIGISLILGPLLLLLIFAGIWPAANLYGAEALTALLANQTYTLLLMGVGGSAFLMITGGSLILSQSQAEQGEASHKQILMLGNMLFVVSLGLFMLQGSLIIGAMNLFSASSSDAVLMHLFSDHITDIMPFTLGGGMILLSLSGIHGSLKPRITGLLLLPGILFIMGLFTTSDNFGFVSWMIFTATYVIVGIAVLAKK
tara:strand:- start:742 stop:1344 length:603 start_codon:yes stop_codon:yes gene_type:complete